MWLLVGLAVLHAFTAAATASAQAPCENEALRSSLGSLRLPDCRAYEMVTPKYKQGYPLFRASYAPDGNKAILFGLPNLAGTTGAGESATRGDLYLDTRNESGGWEITPLNAPSSDFIGQVSLAAEAKQGATLWEQHTPSQSAYRVDLYARRSPTGSFEFIGPLALPRAGAEHPSDTMDVSEKRYDRPVAATSDYTHVVLFARASEDYWKEFDGEEYDRTLSNHGSLYEYSGTDNTHPVLVGVEGPKGSTALIGECGTQLGGLHSTYNALSKDGETIFFTVDPGCGSPAFHEIYARAHGGKASPSAAETVHVSVSRCTAECGPESGKNFEGASEDGKKVFFTSTQKLTNDAVDGTASGDASEEEGCAASEVRCNLYEADIEEEGGHLVSNVRLISGGEVLGVAGMAESGSYVYFVSRTQIAGAGLNEFEREPQAGLPNLYAYDTRTGDTRFVVTLVGGEDANDWTNTFNVRTSEVGGEGGRFLLFMSSAKGVTPDDTGEVLQLYEYDAVTGELVRLTKGEGGFDEDGNGVGVEAAIESTAVLTFAGQLGGGNDFKSAVDVFNMSGDGKTVAFEMRGQLSPYASSAAQGCQSLYAFRTPGKLSEGSVHLISDGRDTQLYKGALCGAQFQGVDATGANILFTTADPVLPTDVDGVQRDIYDARIGGGFGPAPKGEAGACSVACEGPSSSGAVGLPGSPTSLGEPGEAPLPAMVTSTKRAESRGVKLKAALRGCRKKPRRVRAGCERAVRRRYGSSAKAKKSRKG